MKRLVKTTRLSVHTGVMHHIISRSEMNKIKNMLGLNPEDKLDNNKTYSQEGISELSINESHQIYNKVTEKVTKDRYVIELKLNFSRLIGYGEYATMPLTRKNIMKVCYRLQKVLKNIGINQNNLDVLKWDIDRIDTAFDIQDINVPTLMKKLYESIDKNVFLKKRLKEKYPFSYESLYFGNKSYVWNIYDKYTELCKKALHYDDSFIDSSKKEEISKMKNILRIERQNLKGAVNELLPNRCFSDLLKAEIQKSIIEKMASELALFFGEDDPSGIYYKLFEKPLVKTNKRSKGVFPKSHFCEDGRYHIHVVLYSCVALENEYEDNEDIHGYVASKSVAIADKDSATLDIKVYDKLFEVFESNVFWFTGWNNSKDKKISKEEFIYILTALVKSYSYLLCFGEVAKTEIIKQKVGELKNTALSQTKMYNNIELEGRERLLKLDAVLQVVKKSDLGYSLDKQVLKKIKDIGEAIYGQY